MIVPYKQASTKFQATLLGLALSFLSLTIGCGGGRAEVNGYLKHAGEPLAGRIVCFAPEKGPLTQATTGSDGYYSLSTPGVGDGVAPGKYRIYIMNLPTAEEEAAKASIKESDLVSGKPLPVSLTKNFAVESGKYYSPMTTDWIREVLPGANTFDFDAAE